MCEHACIVLQEMKDECVEQNPVTFQGKISEKCEGI